MAWLKFICSITGNADVQVVKEGEEHVARDISCLRSKAKD